MTTTRVISVACLASWALLVALQLRLVPLARGGWVFDLWQYLPAWAGALLAALALALAAPRARRVVAEALWRLDATIDSVRWSLPRMLVVWVGLGLALWLVRDRQLLGDANILIWEAASGRRFLFPDVGATHLVWCIVRLAQALGLGHPGVVAALQIATSLAGALVILFVFRLARLLVPSHASGVAVLILSGGLLRVCAGHIEVYAFLLAGSAAYLWLALDLIDGKDRWARPSLALGVAIWLHPSALALLPSLALALRGQQWRRLMSGLAVAVLTALLLLCLTIAVADRSTLDHASEVLLQVLGRSDDPTVPHRWVRAWGGEPTVGTDYVMLSLPHLKYLANALHLLCAWALPALAWLVWRRREFRDVAGSTAFLAAATLPLVCYSLVLRPVWGPFDWDLFSLTALVLGTSCIHWLGKTLTGATLGQVLSWLVGFNLLFVGVPMLLIGFVPIHPAGPFVPELFDVELLIPGSEAFRRIAPWL